jgi:organic hydroperoxide reductase OsmC/OhrA
VDDQEFVADLELRGGYHFSVEFDQGGEEPLQVDEPPPLGGGAGPTARTLLAAAVGSCMSSSLLFCMRRARLEVTALRTRVSGTVLRNRNGRMRIGGLHVTLHPTFATEDAAHAARGMELFEDFCVVGASVREGIPIHLDVEIDAAIPEPTA